MPHATRLFLILSADTDLNLILDKGLHLADIACLLLTNINTETLSEQYLEHIIAKIQKQNIAVLLEDPSLARRFKADGVHLYGTAPLWETDVIETRKHIPEGNIIGISGLKTRHDAMSAGEQKLDYIMFGDHRTSPLKLSTFEWILERTRWWADIFTTPCVAYAAEPNYIRPLVEAGADFIALDVSPKAPQDDPLMLITKAQMVLG